MRNPHPIAIALVFASCASTQPEQAASGPPATAEPRSYEEMVKAARSYSEAGRGEQAAAAAAGAARMEPQRPEAYALWGRGLAQQKKLEDSAEVYEKARALGSTDREVFIELASVYDVSGRYEEAVAVYRAWLDQTPADVEMRQELGLTLLLRERYAEAVTELDKAAAGKPDDPQIRQDLGYALVRAGQAARAEKVLQKLVDEDPRRREAVIFLARAKALQGRAAQALQLLDGIITGRQASEQAVRMRAHLRVLTGDPQGALDDYGWLLKAKKDDPAALLGAAGALVALGRLDDASSTVDKAATTVEQHPLIDFRRAQIAWRRGEAAALDDLAAFARDNPTSVEAWREVRAAATAAGQRRLAKEAGARLKKLGDQE